MLLRAGQNCKKQPAGCFLDYLNTVWIRTVTPAIVRIVSRGALMLSPPFIAETQGKQKTQHGQTVEQMPCIDHQGQQNGRKKVVRCQKQRNCNKLHGAGVNEQAHKKCPAHVEAGMPFVS